MAIPKYLYHITNYENIYSIIQYGLGAKAGKGINLELAKKGKVYTIDFDPEYYLKESLMDLNNEQQNHVEFLLRICLLLTLNCTYVKFCILRINTESLELRNLFKDIEEFVYIYEGIVDDYSISVYEMIDTEKINLIVSNQDSIYSKIYFKKLL